MSLTALFQQIRTACGRHTSAGQNDNRRKKYYPEHEYFSLQYGQWAKLYNGVSCCTACYPSPTVSKILRRQNSTAILAATLVGFSLHSQGIAVAQLFRD